MNLQLMAWMVNSDRWNGRIDALLVMTARMPGPSFRCGFGPLNTNKAGDYVLRVISSHHWNSQAPRINTSHSNCFQTDCVLVPRIILMGKVDGHKKTYWTAQALILRVTEHSSPSYTGADRTGVVRGVVFLR